MAQVPGPLIPDAPVGDSDGMLGLWFHPGLAPAIVAFWGMIQWMDDLSLPLSVMLPFQ